MVYVFINSSIKVKINEFEPIYNLKEYIEKQTGINIDKQILLYNGTKLIDDKCILDYNIRNWCNIEMKTGLKGGFDSLSVLMWLLYICSFLLYLLLMVSGLMPVIARIYAYIFDWALGKIGELIGMADNSYYKSFVFVATFIISIGIVYYFVYAATAFVTFPLNYTRFDSACRAIQTSNTIAWWVALFFIIVYGIMNIPNVLTNIMEDATEINVVTKAFISPIIGLVRNFANEGKLSPFYAIPFIGTPFLSGYGAAVDIASETVVESIGFVSEYDCQENSREIINMLRGNATGGVGGRVWASKINNIKREYNMEELIKVITLGLDEEKLEAVKCRVDNMPFWDKFGGISAEYHVAKLASQGFCFGLRFIRIADKFLMSLGGSDQIANIIKTGNISGMISLIVFIICLILAMIGWL